MKVAIFTDSWFPRVDGLTTSVLGIKSALERRGHEFHVFASGPRWERSADVTRYKGVPFWGYPDFHVALRPGKHDAAKILRDEEFDLVHIQSPFMVGLWGLLGARKAGLPVITSYHTYIPDLVPYVVPPGFRSIGRRVVWKSTKAFLQRSNLVLAPSPSCAAELLAHCGDGLPPMHVHPNGVDTKRFHPRERSEAMRRRLNPRGGPIVVSVGRLAREKDVPFLVDALALARRQLPGLTLAVGGKGPELPRIQERVRKRGLANAVTFLGFIPDRELASVYASADAFASASAFETQGMTAVEAMACGTPVAAVHARGLADYVLEGRTGSLWAPNDVEEAAWALVQAVNAPQGVRQAARRHAESFSLERSTDQLEHLYRQATGLEQEVRPSILSR
ncbi:MAG: 1,2-diacylglycerol 3-alpha-glucosyltransferase [Thermoplasmata archaeon]|jgi:1,2-diacylglycerol 3-alpha-glucosyltransferase|nr:1,2-diacylglycerol 3-alpha-glucosyltransferase [Thermoplasmata archaeon]